MLRIGINNHNDGRPFIVKNLQTFKLHAQIRMTLPFIHGHSWQAKAIKRSTNYHRPFRKLLFPWL